MEVFILKKIEFDNKSNKHKQDKFTALIEDNKIAEEKNEEYKTFSKKQRLSMYFLIIIATIAVIVVCIFTLNNNNKELNTTIIDPVSSTTECISNNSSTTKNTVTITTTTPETSTVKPITKYTLFGKWSSTSSELILNDDMTFTYIYGTNSDKSIYKGTYSLLSGSNAYSKGGLNKEQAANVFHVKESEFAEKNTYYLILNPTQFSYNNGTFSKVNSSDFEYEPLFSHLLYLDSYNSKIVLTYYDESSNSVFELYYRG
jgi:hypothetical protein